MYKCLGVFCRSLLCVSDLRVLHRAQWTGHDCSFSEFQSEKEKGFVLLDIEASISSSWNGWVIPCNVLNHLLVISSKMHKAVSSLPATTITANTHSSHDKEQAACSLCAGRAANSHRGTKQLREGFDRVGDKSQRPCKLLCQIVTFKIHFPTQKS